MCNGKDSGKSLAVVKIVHYTLIIVGTMVILQTFGIKLTAFAVLAGAIGVGVGFGLQQIISNFVYNSPANSVFLNPVVLATTSSTIQVAATSSVPTVGMGPLTCVPQSIRSPTPFSMGVDRNAVAWVLYSNGQLFQVDTTTAKCTESNWNNALASRAGNVPGSIGAGRLNAGASRSGFSAPPDVVPCVESHGWSSA